MESESSLRWLGPVLPAAERDERTGVRSGAAGLWRLVLRSRRSLEDEWPDRSLEDEGVGSPAAWRLRSRRFGSGVRVWGLAVEEAGLGLVG